MLSPSTRTYDEGEKFSLYARVESARDIVYLASDRIHIRHFHRESFNGDWSGRTLAGKEADLVLTSVGLTLPLAALYEDTGL